MRGSSSHAASRRSGKMVFVFSAVTIILAFAAVIILNISVTYQPRKSDPVTSLLLCSLLFSLDHLSRGRYARSVGVLVPRGSVGLS